MSCSQEKLIIPIRYSIAILIALFSFIHFIFIHNIEPLLSSPTAFEWPSVDMMVYFERALDPHFLPNDFFTSTSHELSPRMIFGEFIIFIAKLLSLDYYTVFFYLKAFLKIFMPPTFYLFLCRIHLGIEKSEKNIIAKDIFLAPWGFLAGTWWAAATFTIANWRPLPIWASPQSLGLFLSLCGGIFLLSDKKQYLNSFIGMSFLFLGTLMHPAMGLFTGIFLILSSVSKKQFIIFSILCALSVGFGILILEHFFSSPFKLSNLEFIKHYVTEPYIHRAHYSPDSFGTYGRWNWHKVLEINLILLLIGFISSLFTRSYRISWLAFIYLISYIGTIMLQIIGIDVFPSRTVAALGPIRFTQFGYAMIALVISGSLSLFLIKQWSQYGTIFKKITFKFSNNKSIVSR